MKYETLQTIESSYYLTVTLHRPSERNSINMLLLKELHQVLNYAEQHEMCRFIVLQGENGVFCTGMDFNELVQSQNTPNDEFPALYMSLLHRFTTTSKIIITLLDGQVVAGGVGLVAASDLVLSTRNTHFSLSEAIWGLLPACVMPFLIRRVGFQKAYYMTLTTQTIIASSAYDIGLIDEITDDLVENLRRLIFRTQRITEQTVSDLKSYFKKMWIVTDMMETVAVNELQRLATKQEVQANIKNFIEHQRFPWE